MSLTQSPLDPDREEGPPSAMGEPCFYCGGPLDDPTVYWMGVGADLYLHPACVAPLFIRLARDVHESERPDYYARRLAASRP